MLDRMKIDKKFRIAMINFEMNGLAACFRVRVTHMLAFLSNLLVVVRVFRSYTASTMEEKPALLDSIPPQKQ